MVKKMGEEREVDAFIDLHGHSCKKNVFMYGCAFEGMKKVWKS
jgi:hypothetical protein